MAGKQGEPDMTATSARVRRVTSAIAVEGLVMSALYGVAVAIPVGQSNRKALTGKRLRNASQVGTGPPILVTVCMVACRLARRRGMPTGVSVRRPRQAPNSRLR